jgi:hypothetical protein
MEGAFGTRADEVGAYSQFIENNCIFTQQL